MEPTGQQHIVEPEDVFFSTTDKRGIIQRANDVFVELSRYSRDELLGSPHNINRHPMMPGGAFRIMWDTLGANQPFGAYVNNLSRDGSRYDVFATITPIPDGYLSVRTAVCCPETESAVAGMYADTVAREAQWREEGDSRHDAAAKGAARLGELVAEAGLGTYTDFLREALPAEVVAREQACGGWPGAGRAAGPTGQMRGATDRVYRELSGWMDELGSLAELSASMRDEARRQRETVAASRETVAAIEATSGDGVPASLLMPLQLWGRMIPELDGVLHQLLEDLDALHASAAESRFLIALARLHVTQTHTFLGEADLQRDGDDDAGSIRLLCSALDHGLATLGSHAEQHRQLLDTVAERVDAAAGLMQIPADLMGAWGDGAQTRDLPEALRELAPRVDEQREASASAIEGLRALGVRCREAESRHDVSGMRGEVASVVEVLGSAVG